MHFFYNLGIHLLTGLMWLAALFHPKAQKWVSGRKNWRQRYNKDLTLPAPRPTLWMHVSSLGEFEQGRPVLEKFKAAYPEWRIALTFYSPSGYEIRKNYALADWVGYLPADTPANARYFIDLLQPQVAVFVKYDFWANYLFTLQQRGTPTLLVSALFRPSQVFFSWHGGFWRRVLGCFNHIFVQNHDSAALLNQIRLNRHTVAGDTRVDRVLQLAQEVQPNSLVARFVGDAPALIVGSSWEKDEQCVAAVLQDEGLKAYKIVLAPHEPSPANVQRLLTMFPGSVAYSALENNELFHLRVLVIDNIGMLNRLYQYGKVAYIGGGFGKGIHNTLEPAAFGLPICFGPKYEKFEEARQLVARGGAFVIQSGAALCSHIKNLENLENRRIATHAVAQYLEQNKGATDSAMTWLKTVLKN
jgi:3-deoxy-D-manno-octulosonic-acid transferase